MVLDDVGEAEVLLVTHGLLQRHRLLVDALDLSHPGNRHLGTEGELLNGRLSALLLDELALDANELVDRLDHVNGDADGAGLVGYGPGDGLADPPGGICGELEPLGVVELVDGPHQAQVPLLYEVEELHPSVAVPLGDGNDEA